MGRRITSIIFWLFGFVVVWLWMRERPPKPFLEKIPDDPVDSMAGHTGLKKQVDDTPRTSDTLTGINGIGTAFEKALNAIGIYTYAQLASQRPADLAEKMSIRITAERIERDRWIEQAQELNDSTAQTDKDMPDV